MGLPPRRSFAKTQRPLLRLEEIASTAVLRSAPLNSHQRPVLSVTLQQPGEEGLQARSKFQIENSVNWEKNFEMHFALASHVDCLYCTKSSRDVVRCRVVGPRGLGISKMGRQVRVRFDVHRGLVSSPIPSLQRKWGASRLV